MSKALEVTSKADEFRKSTEDFWSRMDQKREPVTGRRKPTLTRSSKSDPRKPRTRTIAPTARKIKKRAKR